MRSLFSKILLWFLATIVISIVAFEATSSFFLERHGPDGFFAKALAAMLDDARQAYEIGGPERLAAELQRLDRRYPGEHHMVDTAGCDLVNGVDRSPLLERAGEFRWPSYLRSGSSVHVGASEDGRFRLVVVVRPKHHRHWNTLRFYLWIIVVIAVLCYILAIQLARPLRSLGRTVERFGRGDLSARVQSNRRDEIGDLSRAFDRMAERIETLLNAERRLLQDVSHELRSPLARLHFAVELARTAPDRDASLTRIRREVQRLSSLVDELLRLTRAEGDPSSEELRDVPLHDLLRALVDDCAVEGEALGCTLALKSAPPVVLRGDPELLRRAVENVLRNAIHHAPAGTVVEVGLTLGPRAVTITVRDYGPGVPEEALSEIFLPFFRVEGDRDRASGGVGLGLSIAQRSISLHQGKVTARNASPGLLVTIELPHPRERPEPS